MDWANRRPARCISTKRRHKLKSVSPFRFPSSVRFFWKASELISELFHSLPHFVRVHWVWYPHGFPFCHFLPLCRFCPSPFVHRQKWCHGSRPQHDLSACLCPGRHKPALESGVAKILNRTGNFCGARRVLPDGLLTCLHCRNHPTSDPFDAHVIFYIDKFK